jgi:hypothetical protein
MARAMEILARNERTARYSAFADAFNRIRSSCTASTYCDRWITVNDWLRIICTEYDLIVEDIDFTARDVHNVLNREFRLATFSTSIDGVYHSRYTSSGQGVYCFFAKRTVAPKSAALGNIVGLSNPINKVCDIDEAAKDLLAKILAKKIVSEKESSVEETTRIVPENVTPSTVTRTHSQISGGNDSGEGVPNTRTDAAVLSTRGFVDLDPPHGTSNEPPKKKHRVAPNIASPHAEGLRIMAPINSVPVLQRRQEKEKQTWTMGYAEGEKPPSVASIRFKATHLEQYLSTQSQDNGATVVKILLATLKRVTMADIYKELLSKLGEVEMADDTILLNRQRDFIQYHTSEGSRDKHVQDSIDAVVTASVWTKEKEVSDAQPDTQGEEKVVVQKVAERLGTNWRKVNACSEKASLLIGSGQNYIPFKRKRRSDYAREAAYAAITEFCHCNDSSNLDTESYQFVKVKHQYSGEVESHPFRVWHDLTLKDRYKTFRKSSAFAKFKAEHPDWNICKEVFRQLICKCVRAPGPQSCVDLHMSQLKHYMSALERAMRNNPVIKRRVDMCDECERHQLERDSCGGDDSPVMWETYLSGRPVDLIQSSCCKRKEEPMLCYETGRAPPRMLRWGCTHTKSDPFLSTALPSQDPLASTAPPSQDALASTTLPSQDPLASTALPSQDPCESLHLPAETPAEQDVPLFPDQDPPTETPVEQEVPPIAGQDCEDCGVEKLLRISECPALRDCQIPIPVWEWKLAPRAGVNKQGKQNQQMELTEGKESVNLVLLRFIRQLELCRKHHAEMEWLRITRKADIGTFGPSELLIFTDFSATMDLRASQTDNSSVDAHAALQIFVVLHSPRVVKVSDDNGVEHEKRVHECDVWYFFGSTISKGKKNDHVFHNACLEDIVKHYQRKRGRGNEISRVRIWTDNCASQYKCRQNFWKIASFPSRVAGVEVWHRFGQKYDFKGVWDAAGKVIKQRIREYEIMMTMRFPTAWGCFEYLPRVLGKFVPKIDWKQREIDKDPRLLQKGIFVNSARFFGYVSDIKEEFEKEKNAHRHVVYADRANVSLMKAVDGTQKLHSVSGSAEGRQKAKVDGPPTQEWQLRVACMPCVCLACRGDATPTTECPFIDIRNERVIWASDESIRVMQQRHNTTGDKALFEKASRIMELDGGEHLTVEKLKVALRARGLVFSSNGRKKDLANQLIGSAEASPNT